jgi:hypothetical protein
VLQAFDPFVPMDCDAGERLTIARERLQEAPIVLPEAAISVEEGAFGAQGGFARRREPAPAAPPTVLRYYDIDRDYQPGLQRAAVRAGSGQPRALDLPATLAAADARALVEAAARRELWRRETVSWRCAALDPAVAPGAIVVLPGMPGHWRVAEWEWRDKGVELTLARAVPAGADAMPVAPVDPGRIVPPLDLAAPATALAAFELPWDGTGSGDVSAPFAALSAASAAWRGAALYADRGDGVLQPLGPSGRVRSLLGAAETALPAASQLLLDRANAVVVALVDPAMDLADATGRALAAGANRALLGEEIVQFARAEPLGAGRWRLSLLLRGRGGTEDAIAGHVAGERFVLLAGQTIALDPLLVGEGSTAGIAAVGLGDDEPVVSAIGLRGVTLRPLSPVHARSRETGDGGLELAWTRRARGAWGWADGVDAPLNEQAERYLVTLGDPGLPAALWEVSEPRFALSAATLAALPAGALTVRQQGTHALSAPLLLATLD